MFLARILHSGRNLSQGIVQAQHGQIVTRQRGDTIVEVLICIGVVGLVLAGAFVVTNRSQLGVRNSQEHAEALKLVEGQLEQLRSNAKNHSGEVFDATSFCMVNAAPVSSDVSRANGKCIVDSTGSPTSGQPAYTLFITKKGSDTDGYVFTIQVKWDSITGNGQAQETMMYRLYPS